MKRLYLFLVSLFEARKIIFELAKKDFKAKYLGSYLGVLWAFIQPLIYLFVLWFVFQVGFKIKPVGDTPFILWLATGLVPWFFFSEALTNSTNAIIENSYLIKKVVFRSGTLPIIKILSSLFVHLFFILLLFIANLLYHYPLSIFYLQIFYYLFCAIMLLLGLSFITSALTVFIKDTAQVITILIQFGFWLTPVFWPINILPDKLQFLMKLNPVYYITEGYRNSLVYEIWFWEYPLWTLYFWMATIVIFILGLVIFDRLKPHFADVL